MKKVDNVRKLFFALAASKSDGGISKILRGETGANNSWQTTEMTNVLINNGYYRKVSDRPQACLVQTDKFKTLIKTPEFISDEFLIKVLKDYNDEVLKTRKSKEDDDVEVSQTDRDKIVEKAEKEGKIVKTHNLYMELDELRNATNQILEMVQKMHDDLYKKK